MSLYTSFGHVPKQATTQSLSKGTASLCIHKCLNNKAADIIIDARRKCIRILL